MSRIAALADLILPRSCVGCGSPVAAWCPLCLPTDPLLRVTCAGLPVLAASPYSGPVRTALLAFKERGRRDLAAPLAGLLARAVRGVLDDDRAPPPGLLLVPVPSSRSAAAARGGDHLARLARRVSAATGVRVAVDALELTRPVRDSAHLSPAERAANVGEAMRSRSRPPGMVALLVDDIVTTGATLGEARRALGVVGWPVLGAAVIAATPRRGAPATGRRWQGGLA